MVGWPYRKFGRDSGGIDCLGVFYRVYAACGIDLPEIGESFDGRRLYDLFCETNNPQTGDGARWSGPEGGHIAIVINEAGRGLLFLHADKARGCYTETARKVIRAAGNPTVRYYRYTG